MTETMYVCTMNCGGGKAGPDCSDCRKVHPLKAWSPGDPPKSCAKQHHNVRWVNGRGYVCPHCEKVV